MFKICGNYGNHLQYSIFECDLAPGEKTALENELLEVIHCGEDQVLFVALGPTESRGERVIAAIGLPYTRFDSPCYVL